MNTSNSLETDTQQQPDDNADAIDLLGWFVTVLLSDGNIESHQRKLLYNFCQHRGVSKQDVDALITRTQNMGQTVDMKPQSSEEALSWLKSMALAGLADETVESDELLLLRIAGQKLGFSDTQINRVIFDIRKQMRKEAEKGMRSRFFG